ncbi:dihydrolipoamide acetyltransferase family protein [Halohasta salina]|uniref:dihydrolipoamide acetyltransferase family protein n=1 Tax=Halohasta salina TaxID=2961621 RepID=UPI0020A50EA2|nr:dihydrolipoamide acetyltransferase family protein [Halohasta salina]
MAGNPITLPELGGGATEGELVAWLVEPGETVEDDQPIAEVETEKSVVEVPAPAAGTVTERLVEAGSTVEVGAEIGRIEPGESTPTDDAVDTPAEQDDAPADEVGVPDERVFAPPRVRRLARELGVDIAGVEGSEAGGRIGEADVRAAAEREAEPEDSGPKPFTPSGKSAVSKREADSDTGVDGPKPVTPSGEAAVSPAGSDDAEPAAVAYTSQYDTAVVNDLEALRAELDPHAAEQGVELTLLPLVIKAVIRTLADVPALNATVDADGTVDQREATHVGIAVATDDGLAVPVVEDADETALVDLAAEIGDLVDRAEAGDLTAAEADGATFTVTTPGAIGDEYATLPIEGDRTASLTLGAIDHRPVVADGEVVASETLPLSLAVDSRVVDPTEAAAFVEGVVGYLESPNRLLLGSV